MKRYKLSQNETIKVYNTPVCGVEFKRYSSKNQDLLIVLMSEFMPNIDNDGWSARLEHMTKCTNNSQSYYRYLIMVVDFFETSLWNDFTEYELKLKDNLYNGFLNNITKF